MRHRTRLAWAVAAALAAASPVQAFYWDGWPGSSLPRPRTLTPEIPPIPTANPTFPPSGEPPGPTPGGPGDVPNPGGPGELPNPENVPEPASGLAVLIGLGAFAARQVRRA